MPRREALTSRVEVNKTTPGVNKSQLKIARRNHVIFCRVQQLQEFHKSSEHIQEPLKFVFKIISKHVVQRIRIAKPEKKNYALKSKKEKLGIEEQKEKLRIEEQKVKLRIEEREEKLRFEQLRLDEQKRKDEFESEKLRIQTQSKLGADTSKESDTKFLVKEVSKFIHRFDLKEDISLYLKLFERQAQRLNIDQENWVTHLLGLVTDGNGLKIDTFNKLSDLIITDQLKRKTPFEFEEYYLDEWANMNSPVELAEKLEEFEDFKRTLKQKSSSPLVKKQEYKFTEKNRSSYWIRSFEQASISFTKEGVKFNKYENHAQLMQISAENLQEELDLRHVENRQIKKEGRKS
ncbi:uncharacterized protein TNCV_2641031 [Trichonephila clavipes]|nr:uncharacterized protein TNCV_2641031 [Trichonephila clavipes]